VDHLGIDSTEARRALLTGDPDRVPELVERLGGGHWITSHRGFLCHEATIGDDPLLVVGTGIGAPGTAIVVEELAELGVHTMVRLGTCGGLAPGIEPGHLVVPTGCVRDEGTSHQYIEASFPAVPDHELTTVLITALADRGAVFHCGITHCKDAYYLERPEKQLCPGEVGGRWRALRDAGVLATEMEASVLFVLGSLRRLRTAAVFVNVGTSTDAAAHATALDHAVAAVEVALESVGPPGRPGGPRVRSGVPTSHPESYLDRSRAAGYDDPSKEKGPEE